MKALIIFACLALAAMCPHPVRAQTVLTAPYVAGCPSPVPDAKGLTGWPPSTCKYVFYPLTDTTHALASVSKTQPRYQHRYAGYASTPATLLVACPKGATLSRDQTSCSNGNQDASALVAFSQLSAFSIVQIPAVADYPVSWVPSVDGYLVQHSEDGGKTWDAGTTVSATTSIFLFHSLPTSVVNCFKATTLSKAWGDYSSEVVCQPAGTIPANVNMATQ